MTADCLGPVSLPDLQASGPRRWQIQQPLAGLHQAGPVQGELSLRHLGDGVEVGARVHTELACTCDRCLRPFTTTLRAEAEERLPFHPPADGLAPLPEALEERLDPSGSFDPEHWLFEQISLRLPLVNRCGPDCPGPATWSSSPAAADPRWAALARLQGG